MGTTTRNKVIIGTRGSKLALWQAAWVKSELEKLDSSLNIELNTIKTTGDMILDVPLAKIGGKGLFVKEIEEALLKREADLAVHSMKDVPTEFPGGLHLGAICRRENPHDAFLSRIHNSKFQIPHFKNLPEAATVGTSSLRRSCQLLNIRPDIKIAQLRGNLDTRIRKLDEGQFDAIILAVAGVKRLGWEERITEVLSENLTLPAIGQGAIGIECRIDDTFINSLIAPLNHKESSLCVKAERAFLKRLEGGCQVPIAAYARIMNDVLVMDGLVCSLSGDTIIKDHSEGKPQDAESIGTALAETLLAKGADKILADVYGSSIRKADRS